MKDGHVKRRLRLGMVGGGEGAFIGAVHRAAARLCDQFDLVAGCFSSNVERAQQSARSIGISPENTYADFHVMARDAARLELDAVAIVTPNFLHVPVAQAFAEHGVHIICDKPLAAGMDGVDRLGATVERQNLVFILTHTYSAYPMIRRARQIVASGNIGRVRSVSVEYLQDWLATSLEATGNRQAEWRTDPARGGMGGAVGDIGTHAFHLAEYVSGESCAELLSMTNTTIQGRGVNDDAMLLLRFASGAKGNLWCSQVAVGCKNALTIRVFGERGALAWAQETAEQLCVFNDRGEQQILRRGEGPGEGALPAGHPEGFYEAFSQIYRDAAHQIRARRGDDMDAAGALAPEDQMIGLQAGIRGMHFIEATLNSAARGNSWVTL